MLRLVFAMLVSFAILVAGILIFDPESSLAQIAIGTVAMLVGGLLAPHVFIRGDWPPPRRQRTD
jgi:hypothetical protein